MTPASVESLSAMGVHTMEQFVELSDDQAKYLGIYNLKHEAVKILGAQDNKQVQLDELKAQNDALLKRLEALEKPAKAKKELTPEQKAKRAESLKKAREVKKKMLEEAKASEE